jgi:geranylgeranyl pyrophosphate synthase
MPETRNNKTTDTAKDKAAKVSNAAEFKAALKQKAQTVNQHIDGLLEKHEEITGSLRESMKYTLEAPGKRLRAALTLATAELTSNGTAPQEALTAAAAVEIVHTYSLIHDDLPCMDDDDIRRGLPSCHKAFGQAQAVLTGDALLTFAFEILATEINDSAVASQLSATLARAAGPGGMVAGQVADIENTDETNSGSSANTQTLDNTKLLAYIHTNKTARMFAAAASMGAITSRAGKNQVEAMYNFGLKTGLAFQIADDILDVSATSEQLGKTAGKDAQQGKLTYPAMFGLDKSRKQAKKLLDEALEILDGFDSPADFLRQLAAVLLERTK